MKQIGQELIDSLSEDICQRKLDKLLSEMPQLKNTMSWDRSPAYIGGLDYIKDG